ncbi:MAG TPA: MgtC/SapB family protein [Syntrophomonadaceae bacterium]|nr:MgtC/SapB family protein [Syntrophomonadaceae bacterium]
MGWIIVKILAAGIVGFIIGLFNKSLNNLEQSARVFAIISVGAALTSIISMGFFKSVSYTWTSDPGRISAQVISALGFLGTGLIWMSEKDHKIKGVSVASSLWVTAILGMLIGAGLTTPAVLGVFFVVIIYWVYSLIDWDKVQNWKNNNHILK